MSAEFWAIIAVLGLGVAILGLGWRMYVKLDAKIDAFQARVDARLAEDGCQDWRTLTGGWRASRDGSQLRNPSTAMTSSSDAPKAARSAAPADLI